MTEKLTNEQREVAKKTARTFIHLYEAMLQSGLDRDALFSGVSSSFLTVAKSQLDGPALVFWLHGMADALESLSRQDAKSH